MSSTDLAIKRVLSTALSRVLPVVDPESYSPTQVQEGSGTLVVTISPTLTVSTKMKGFQRAEKKPHRARTIDILKDY
jgi:hypothetical protein